MKTILKLTIILSLALFYNCEKEEFLEGTNAQQDTPSNQETKMASKCEVTIKSLASHTRVIYRASDNATTIRVNEWRNGKALTIRTSFGVCKIPKPYDELIIYGGKGNDSIIINRSVKTPTMVYPGDGNDFVRNISNTSVTFVTLGDGKDKIVGNKKNTRFWIDPEDTHNASNTEKSSGKLNVVTSFENSDKKLDSPEIQDDDKFDLFAHIDATWDYIPISETSLWGIDLPGPYDVQQGFFQECNFTGRWASVVDRFPEKVQELAVELGDGTYAFKIGGQKYARVDQDFLPFHLSRPGISGKSWFVFLQKAYSYINLDYPEPLTYQFITYINTRDDYTANEYLEKVQEYIDSGYILECSSVGKNLEIGVSRFHMHSVLGVEDDKIIIRNPYGDVFDALWKPEYNSKNGRVALSYEEFKKYFIAITVNEVLWE